MAVATPRIVEHLTVIRQVGRAVAKALQLNRASQADNLTLEGEQ